MSNYDLLDAVIKNNEHLVSVCLKRCNINDRDKNNNTALHIASINNNHYIVDMILKKNPLLNVQNKYGNTPLMEAIRHENYDIAYKLVINSTDLIYIKNNDGKTSLRMILDCNNDFFIKSTLIMIPNYIELKLYNLKCSNIITNVSKINQSDSVEDAEKKIAKGYIFNNYDDNLISKFLKSGNKKLVKLLIRYGIDIRLYKHNPLFTACELSMYDMVYYFNENFNCINDIDTSNGYSILHYAVKQNKINVVRKLIELKINCNIKDLNNCIAIDYAIRSDIIKLLLPHSNLNNLKNDGCHSGIYIMKYSKISYDFVISKWTNITSEDYYNLLKISVIKNDVNMFERFIGCIEVDLSTFLKEAIIYKKYKIIKYLIDNKVTYKSLLYDSILYNNLILTKHLIDDLHYEYKINDFIYPLISLCGDYDALPMIDYLIKLGIDINGSYDDYTPLKNAVYYRKKSIIYKLLEHKANVNIICDEKSLLYKVCLFGDYDLILAMLKNGADCNIDNIYTSPLYYSVSIDNIKIASLLLEYGANIINSNKLLSVCKSKEMTELLLNNGIDIKYIDEDGNTILHVISKVEDQSIIGLILKYKPDINAKNILNETALHIACKNNNVPYVRNLLKHNADVNIKNNFGLIPLYYAFIKYNKVLVKLLIDNGSDINSIVYQLLKNYIINDNESAFDKLMHYHIDINIKYQNESIIHYACNSENIKYINKLIANGADVNSKDNDGCTPLHIACKHGNKDIINKLISSDSLMSIFDNNGLIPFMYLK